MTAAAVHPRALALLAAVLLAPLGCAASARGADPAAVVRATPGAVAYWPLDERDGAVVTDALAGQTGALTGAPTLGAPTARFDDNGAALGLTGTSAVSLGAAFAPANELSLEAWVWVSPGSGGTRYALSKGNASSGVHLLVDGAGRPLFRVGTTAGASTVTGPALESGSWHQLVATLAGTTAALFVDRRPVASGSLQAAPVPSSRALYLGRYSASSNGYWQGRVDEVSLYARALTAGDIAAHYAAVADPTPPTVTLISRPPARVSSAAVTVSFAASKPQSTFRCRLDTGPWTACDSPVTYGNLGEGAHERDRLRQP